MFNFFKKKIKIGCPACNDENTYAFSEELIGTKYEAKIEKLNSLGTIDLYKCTDCNTEYYKEQNMFNLLTAKSKEIIVKYFEQDLVLKPIFKKQIEEIGITEDWNLNKLIPAKVELIDGDFIDFVRVIISNKPPIGYIFDRFKRVLYLNQVKSIEKSDFALSKEIRDQTINAEELRMGFYPTVLKTGNKKIVINGLTLFFDLNNIIGSELQLDNGLWDFNNNKYIYDNESIKETLLIVREQKTMHNHGYKSCGD